jgi:hypothetical protein
MSLRRSASNRARGFLPVSEPLDVPLPRAVQELKLSVAVRGSERPFCQARYYDFNVQMHDKHVETLRSMNRNWGRELGMSRVTGVVGLPALCDGVGSKSGD